MYTHKFVYLTKNPRKLTRLFPNKRRSWFPCIILFSLCFIIMIKHRSNSKRIQLESFDKIKLLLDQLFNPLISLNDLQIIWNKLIKIWQEILIKFLHDACKFCHKNHFNCYKSINLTHYIYHINQSFYPFNEIKRPIGMGIYYYFDLKTLHSFNNSILSTDVSYCDYFHMIQLMINVQIILHEANIKYFLTKGTLIGVLRHHDIIPWDTDIDLFIPSLSIKKLLKSFRQLDISINKNQTQNYQQNLVIYRFINIYKISSYKIFSLNSPIINGTNYRWPKIDIFPYEENSTHIYAYPKQQHNLGTMNYILKTNIEPIYLRLLGPILVPSPYHPRKSLKAMIKLGQSNVFYVCEGNRFLHRYNQKSNETWRVPCEELHKSYLFVKSQYNSTNNLCSEQLISYQKNQSLSLYVYKCDEDLQKE